ncbi:hypothetical protein OFO07_07295 [Campylobacter sp. JMF_06 NA1]|uniref:hypothetical protein n=1 Tax=Campylobacter sp. JMF_06 NA1 TaxID=2983823 RepID=UPI0022E9F4CF|nr:hypothetical protein [Campylobacter sp. JMF_06 NA1]MDA3078719.1 hypothetical protein [Campylobacter sp. JMF_06 NA1]
MDNYGAWIVGLATILLFKIFKFCFKNLYSNLIEIYTKDFWESSNLIQILVVCGIPVFMLFYGYFVFTIYEQIANRYIDSYERVGDVVSYERPNVFIRQRTHMECNVELMQNGKMQYLTLMDEKICSRIDQIHQNSQDKCVKILYGGSGREHTLQDCNKNELYRNYYITQYSSHYKESAVLFVIFILITLTIKFLRQRRQNELSGGVRSTTGLDEP